jgi:hypothetical protein
VQDPQHTGIRAVPHSTTPHFSHGWPSGVAVFAPFDTEDESDLVTEVCWPVLGAVTPDLA